MDGPGPRFSVVRTLGGTSYTDVALVRTSGARPHHGHLHRRVPDETVVVHHRTFRPLLERTELEAYAGQLEQAADHGNTGSLWYFVTTTARPDGTVAVSLYDRWFDGTRLRCERQIQREFDVQAETSVAPSLEFAAGLRAWADARNADRDALLLEANADEVVQTERSGATASAAADLADLLASVGRPGPAGS
jgi:hypothetical protein